MANINKGYQAVGKYILLMAKLRQSTGIVFETDLKGKTANQRRWLIEYTKVVSVGDEVKLVKPGDVVFTQSFVFNQNVPLMHLYGEGSKESREEQYFWCKEEDIAGVIKDV
jgi:hypothetical protein